MIAQMKADVRIVADKPGVGVAKAVQDVIVDKKDLLDDQVAAAAVVEAEQAEAVAAQIAADGGILPTAAPVAQSIGEVAQAPAPTTTDTTTTTTPPPMAEESAGMSPWAIGGIALGAVAGGFLIKEAFDSDDNPPAAPPPVGVPPPAGPPPVQPPAPAPANTAPTGDNKQVPLTAEDTTAVGAIPFFDADGDTLASITVTGITVGEAPADTATNNYEKIGTTIYELVANPAGLTWTQANEAAIAKGGTLAILDTAEEITGVKSAFGNVFDTGGGGAMDGTWVGLSQLADQAGTGDGWTWVNGTALAGDSLLWNKPTEPNDIDGTENNEENFGAIYDAEGAPVPTAVIFDTNGPLTQYLIEYGSALTRTAGGAPVAVGETILANEIANLTWNSMFNEGGSFGYTLNASAGAQQTANYTVTFGDAPIAFADSGAAVSSLIEDQHMSVLA